MGVTFLVVHRSGGRLPDQGSDGYRFPVGVHSILHTDYPSDLPVVHPLVSGTSMQHRTVAHCSRTSQWSGVLTADQPTTLLIFCCSALSSTK
ncbi:hypothetical protein CDAR_597211 [Caerostris darwini]|uniref:Uncharacterized protein n=1 Tax=Caerostris darwini TaxID=1538125 RepID=A0AAV4U2H9_9ARAC|nr:hypothetical protein CDAR_597211 [Caerostris darwini]